jgi:hypothetical protein
MERDSGFLFAVLVRKKNKLIRGMVVIKNSHDRIHDSKRHCWGAFTSKVSKSVKSSLSAREKIYGTSFKRLNSW